MLVTYIEAQHVQYLANGSQPNFCILLKESSFLKTIFFMCLAVLEVSRFLDGTQLELILSYIRKSNLKMYPF